jgi:uncharacterized protein
MPSGASANENRLEHIDLVRGYALLGVLLMNIQYWFRAPQQLYHLSGGHPWPGTLNFVADTVLKVWFDGKSLALFSMLFAVGLCIQREHIVAKGLSWGPYAARRLGALAVFGALHILLLWNGDVLHEYALVGLLILPFLKRTPKTLSWWLGGVVAFRVTVMTLVMLATAARGPETFTALPPGMSASDLQTWADEVIRGYHQQSWIAVMHTRLWDFTRIVRMSVPFYPIAVFFNFLVGLWIWSRGILQSPAAHREKLGRVASWGIGLGVVMALPGAFESEIQSLLVNNWGWARLILPVRAITGIFGNAVLAVGIGAALVWCWQDTGWRERLRPLTFVGRMGFTNYIMQSVICTFIFYGWGLGYYNQMGPALGALLGLGIFALQIPASRWWLRRYHFGPLEWLWRSLTYATLAPCAAAEQRITARGSA